MILHPTLCLVSIKIHVAIYSLRFFVVILHCSENLLFGQLELEVFEVAQLDRFPWHFLVRDLKFLL